MESVRSKEKRGGQGGLGKKKKKGHTHTQEAAPISCKRQLYVKTNGGGRSVEKKRARGGGAKGGENWTGASKRSDRREKNVGRSTKSRSKVQRRGSTKWKKKTGSTKTRQTKNKVRYIGRKESSMKKRGRGRTELDKPKQELKKEKEEGKGGWKKEGKKGRKLSSNSIHRKGTIFKNGEKEVTLLRENRGKDTSRNSGVPGRPSSAR